jgi:hypothetical protein
MRTLSAHKLPGLNDALTITVLDEPGPGGACHRYRISGIPGVTSIPQTIIEFQRGPVLEAGVNGISNEALLSIVEDRLASFQAGPFACPENSDALDDIRSAIVTLHSRTRARLAQGVEGITAPHDSTQSAATETPPAATAAAESPAPAQAAGPALAGAFPAPDSGPGAVVGGAVPLGPG